MKQTTNSMDKDSKILHLGLTREWFDMIASGRKYVEYRELKPFWLRRLYAPTTTSMALDFNFFFGKNVYILEKEIWLRNLFNAVSFKSLEPVEYDFIEFTLGYPSKYDHTKRLLKRHLSTDIEKPLKGMCPYEWMNKTMFAIHFE